jgi:MFS family permease
LQPKPITRPLWTALLLIGFAGSLAWAVENQFFNTFMYDNITPDPRHISWMVSITAVVSTLTTIFMGTLSDRTRTRWGRRKPFIFVGYIAWGIFTALYPTAALFQPVMVGVAMAILFDGVMTFFGSTANDSTFNAYVADITTVENRGRVTGALEILKWISFLIVYGGAGLIIEALGYYAFFYIIGGVVSLIGLVCGPMLKEEILLEKPKGSYFGQIADTFRRENLAANRDFFLVLTGTMLWNVSQQIYFPYLLIYLQHFIKLATMESAVLVAVAILVGGVPLAYPMGIIVDKVGRKRVAVISVIFEMVGLLLFSFSRSYAALLVTGILWLAPLTAWTIATYAWSKDLFPEEKRGQFAGYVILFGVAFAMIPGPLLGGWLSAQFGIPTVLDGKPGFIPTPVLFQAAALGTLLALIPVLAAGKKK